MKLEWFALTTGYSQENVARHHLVQNRLRCLLPFQRLTSVKGDRTSFKLQPLFPGYIFVQCRWDRHNTSVVATKGVRSFVGYTSDKAQALAIHPANMETLLDRLEQHNGWDVLKQKRLTKIEEGVLVEALIGPFRGVPLPAHLVSGNRIELAYPMLGQTVTRVFEIDELRLA